MDFFKCKLRSWEEIHICLLVGVRENSNAQYHSPSRRLPSWFLAPALLPLQSGSQIESYEGANQVCELRHSAFPWFPTAVRMQRTVYTVAHSVLCGLPLTSPASSLDVLCLSLEHAQHVFTFSPLY